VLGERFVVRTLPKLYEVVALARAGAIDTEVQRFARDEALDAYAPPPPRR
jgi:hypothetical protein